MEAEQRIESFLQVALDGCTKKISNLSVSVIVEKLDTDPSATKCDKGKNNDAITINCKNILLNTFLKSGQEVILKKSKLAQAYGIAGVKIDSCLSENGKDCGLLTMSSNIEITTILSKDFYFLKRALECDRIRLEGLNSKLRKLENMLTFSRTSRFLSRRQIGVLLHGPSGCGKSSLVRVVAQNSGAVVVEADRTEILQSESGGSAEALKNLFRRAKRLTNEGQVILFFDELDTLCPQSSTNVGSRQLTSALSCEMDKLQHDNISGLLVVGATNTISSLDHSLRCPGRFDREVLINIPSKDERLSILKLYTENLKLCPDVNLSDICLKTPGYVGSDLRALCEEAENNAIKRSNSSPEISSADVDLALHQVRPVMKRGSDILIDVKPVYWQDIGGLEDVKLEIQQAIEWPLKHPEALQRMDLSPTKGVLLHGPPGCCKTTLVRAAATSCHVTFLSLNGAQVFSPFVGESEKIIVEAFQKARALSPSVIFFDEIETLVGKRSSERSNSRVQERILATMLNEMDGVGIRLDKKTKETFNQDQQMKDCNNSETGSLIENVNTINVKDSQVIVIGATNRPDMLDAAILRPGRLDKHIYVPPPDAEAREKILKVFTSKMATADIDLHRMSLETENYTGADLKNLCKEAGLFALREMMNGDCKKILHITESHFEMARDVVKPSLCFESKGPKT